MRRISFGSSAIFLLALVACDRPPSPGEAREWTAKDHDRVEENARVAQGQQAGGQQAGGQPGQPGSPRPPMQMPTGKEAEELVEQLWTQVCSGCHGATGKGDGPNKGDATPPDLTDPAWQTKTSDADIASAIKNGKGKMPKFGFPDPFVVGLTKKIRAMRASK